MSRWHLYRQYLSWQLFSISWIAQLFLTQFWPNFLGALIFSDQNCFWPKIFLDPTFFGLKKFWPNFFEQKMFLTLNCFKTNSKMTSHQPNLVLLSLALLSPSLLILYYYVTQFLILVNLSPNLPAQLQLELRARVASKIN